jgi:hypothetical protein
MPFVSKGIKHFHEEKLISRSELSLNYSRNTIPHYIVTNEWVVRVIKTWVLDWTLDLFDTWRLQHLWLQFTLWHYRQLTQLQSIAYRYYTHSLQPVFSSLYTHWVLLVCCPSSTRVPASHGGHSPSWVPELSPSHSHNSRCSHYLRCAVSTAHTGTLSTTNNSPTSWPSA